jgi:hypothetical protein
MPVPLNAWLAGAHYAATTSTACDAVRHQPRGEMTRNPF